MYNFKLKQRKKNSFKRIPSWVTNKTHRKITAYSRAFKLKL